ncbi:MAG: FGGY-family carbohydrate kinase [Pseudomonadota bacterium]
MTGGLICAVDVGTGSARAGIFDTTGHLLGRGDHPIAMNRPSANHAEHDSEDVWRSVCRAVQAAKAKADARPEDVVAISFDATCSLVVRGTDGRQIGVSTSGESRWDTIVWLDHRALAEADECTATGHEVLDHIGGVMSPEMQTPKLMWLKRNLPSSWSAAGHFFDLVDFLTWKATGSTARSQCTLTTKWTYLAHDGGWRRDFFEAVGLDDMLGRGGLPEIATAVGTSIGTLTSAAARDLGLPASCRVGTGLIDAFAGSLGVIGAHAADTVDRHLALIAGTSSCVMAFSGDPRMVPGIWGPYFGTALPGLWQSEGGQSATGALLDHIIRLHGQGGEPDAQMHARIIGRIGELRAAEPHLAPHLHVLPDFHGNRSPFADPHATGAISGLTLDASFDGLCRLYWRAAVSIALGVRQILDHMNAHGYRIESLHVTGGHTRNPLLMELYAGATGVVVAETEAEDAVLLGTAMAGAAAAGMHADVATACREMRQPERRRLPDPSVRATFDRDYAIFQAMHRHQRELARIASDHSH